MQRPAIATFPPPIAVSRDSDHTSQGRGRASAPYARRFNSVKTLGYQLPDGGYAQLLGQNPRSKVLGWLKEPLRAARSTSALRRNLPALLVWALTGEGRKHLPFSFSVPRDEEVRAMAVVDGTSNVGEQFVAVAEPGLRRRLRRRMED